MKTTITFLFLFILISRTSAKERWYTGSTPAGNMIRSFLGIATADSIDFIRWKIAITDTQYHVWCNYGIGKRNTNGFINNGKKIELSGIVHKKQHLYNLQNGDKVLLLAELNANLLHIMDTDYHLLVGNSGWSYTLSNTSPEIDPQTYIAAKQAIFKDSITFDGRTPCFVPGIVPSGTMCYKLKWRIILYAGAAINQPATYKASGTPYRIKGDKRGSCTTTKAGDGRTIYQLNDDKGKGIIFLLQADNNIVFFTDTNGKLLTGDADFSYTLNRRER